VAISRPHTINNNVNIHRIDNIIDRVRSGLDVLTEILTIFRKTGIHFINTRCIGYKCQFNMSDEQKITVAAVGVPFSWLWSFHKTHAEKRSYAVRRLFTSTYTGPLIVRVCGSRLPFLAG